MDGELITNMQQLLKPYYPELTYMRNSDQQVPILVSMVMYRVATVMRSQGEWFFQYNHGKSGNIGEFFRNHRTGQEMLRKF